jgi:tetratricopeptide (TPR) repeat protein
LNARCIVKIKPHIVPSISLFVLALVVYSGSTGHRFLLNWDDINYIVENAAVRGISWEHLKSAFTRFYVGNYAPLHILSYMLDYELWGLRPFGFVLTNVVIHALNGVLFYLLVVRMGGRRLHGFIAAFIFLFHPVQVESVAWISQRKTVLAMFFFLLSFYSYILYRDDGREEWLYYVASVVAFVFSLLSKSVTVIMPLVLFLYDICLTKKRDLKRLVADKLPYVFAAAIFSFVAIASQRLQMSAGLTPHLGGSPLSTLFTMLPVLAGYLRLLFLPMNLSVLYMPPIKATIDAAVLLSGLLVAALFITGVVFFRSNRRLFFWFALFFIGLLPVSQIVPLVTFFNDRYLYFPLLGASALAAYAADFLSNRPGRYQRVVAASVLGLLLLLLPLLSWKRTSVWQNDLTLWSDTVTKEPDCPDAWFALGMSYDDAGLGSQSLFPFIKVLMLDPDNRYALSNAGGVPGLLEARRLLLQILAESPNSYEGRMLLGTDFYLTGAYTEAEQAFRSAVQLRPQSAWPLRWLGRVCLKTGKIDTAREYYRKAVGMNGTDAELEFQRALVEALGNNPADAMRHLDLAFRLGYKNFEALQNTAELNSLRRLPGFQRLLDRYFSGMVNQASEFMQ